MKQKLTFFIAIFALVSLGFITLKKREQNPKKPNILWITNEDMSPNHLGCYGGKVAKTPNIDQLAKEGVLYTHAFSTAGACAPSLEVSIALISEAEPHFLLILFLHQKSFVHFLNFFAKRVITAPITTNKITSLKHP